ncbi:MAG: hypothetical protein WA323_02580 [Candidatus Nitrosopolaris sp.]
MTISMHGDILAIATTTPIASVGDPGYQLTVNVPSYPSGTSTLGISIKTANGYTDQASVAASGITSWTFNIQANQGWVRVCVNSDNISRETCNTYNTTGGDISVSLSPPSGDSNRYYINPGNSYYILLQAIGTIIISTTSTTISTTAVILAQVVTRTAVIIKSLNSTIDRMYLYSSFG